MGYTIRPPSAGTIKEKHQSRVSQNKSNNCKLPLKTGAIKNGYSEKFEQSFAVNPWWSRLLSKTAGTNPTNLSE